MTKPKFQSLILNARTVLACSGALAFLACASFFTSEKVSGQAAINQEQPTNFRIGERLTYAVSFGPFTNVAYAELYTVSRGRLSDRDAVELRMKLKTLDLLSAAFYLVDEERTTFAAADSGLPLHVSINQKAAGLPRLTTYNYLLSPTQNFDLVTLIHKIRHFADTGAFTLQDGDKTYGVTFQTTGVERIKTDAGEFETSVIAVQSDFLTENGLKDLRINITSDDARIPAMIRFKAAKGDFRAAVASIQMIQPDPGTQPVPTPIQTPRPNPTPAATPSPAVFADNQPLAPELSFALGELLEYNISYAGQPSGRVAFHAKERKLIAGIDTLVLTANITAVSGGNRPFSTNNRVLTYVNPETLAPYDFEMTFAGLNQKAKFDQKSSTIMFNGTNSVESPVGTHSILSFIYALRSFNLKPSRDSSNPVNDTRVAVFWEDQPYIFTLRPSAAEAITVGDEKVMAQLVTVSTGNQKLDQLAIKIWLGTDDRRVPLRFTIGPYQLDLASTR